MEFSFRMCFFIICTIPIVRSFSWTDCGNSTQPIRITSLDATCSVTRTLFVTGRGKLAENFTTPVQANIVMQKKFFWGWTKLPCVEHVGSCTFEDVCQLITYKSGDCPDEFKKNNIPCSCPIEKGQYAVKQFPIDLNMLPKWIESGAYNNHLFTVSLTAVFVILQVSVFMPFSN